MCECRVYTSCKKKSKPIEYPLNILIPVNYYLPCEAASIIEIYDKKILLEKLNVKVLGTQAVLEGIVKVTLYYFSVDNQLHRATFQETFVEGVELGFYYQGTPKVKISKIYCDFSLTDEVKTKCESLGYRKVIGQIIVKGKMRTPKNDW